MCESERVRACECVAGEMGVSAITLTRDPVEPLTAVTSRWGSRDPHLRPGGERGPRASPRCLQRIHLYDHSLRDVVWPTAQGCEDRTFERARSESIAIPVASFLQ